MVYRIFVEKREAVASEAKALAAEIRTFLGIKGLEDLRIINRYDVEGISEELFDQCVNTVFSEPQVDDVYKALDTDRDKPLYIIEGTVPSLNNVGKGCRFAGRCRYATEACRSTEVPLYKVDENHKVRCLKYKEKEVIDNG